MKKYYKYLTKSQFKEFTTQNTFMKSQHHHVLLSILKVSYMVQTPQDFGY